MQKIIKYELEDDERKSLFDILARAEDEREPYDIQVSKASDFVGAKLTEEQIDAIACGISHEYHDRHEDFIINNVVKLLETKENVQLKPIKRKYTHIQEWRVENCE